ncbi:MAG: hypothetical protein B7Z55_19510, partial [Planctomycetales bacterium 12-60-4]
RAPDNLFLLTELLLQQAESHAEATSASLAHLQKIAGPLREGILRRTRVNIEDYIVAARDGISAGDWKVVLGKCRQLSAVIRPEDRTQADLRELTPHALEFVLADFTPGVCPNVPSSPVGAESKFSIAETTFDVAGLGQIQDAVPVDFDLDGRMEILVLGDRGLRVVSDDINSGLSIEMPLTSKFTGLVAADFDRDATEAKTQPTTGVCQDADPDVILFGPAGVTVYRNHLAEDGNRQLVVVEQSGGLEFCRRWTSSPSTGIEMWISTLLSSERHRPAISKTCATENSAGTSWIRISAWLSSRRRRLWKPTGIFLGTWRPSARGAWESR